MNKILLYLVGKPGSGKGTIAQNLVKMLDAEHVIASKLLYKFLLEEYGENSREIEQVLAGKNIEYYPALDTLIIDNILKSNKNLIVLDGYPRIDNQRKAHIILTSANSDLQKYRKIILKLKISDIKAFNRIIGRRICENCMLVYSLSL